MRNISFVNNQFYHIFNRGTDKRKIFLFKKDYERFLKNMIFFNNEEESFPNIRRLNVQHSVLNKKQPLVDILCFCLMSNHYHLMLRQRVDNGISKYLHKLQMGYSKYFNLLYERSGNLFQGPYKAVLVEKQNQFQYLPLYVHLNPLEIVEPNWEEGGVNDIKMATAFLEKYPWSSLGFYIQNKKVSYLEMKTLSSLYSPSDWKPALKDWLKGAVRHSVLNKRI